MPTDPRTKPITILYRNHRGEEGIRRILPLALEYRAEPPWHPEPGWILVAHDLDKQAERSFAWKDILDANAGEGDLDHLREIDRLRDRVAELERGRGDLRIALHDLLYALEAQKFTLGEAILKGARQGYTEAMRPLKREIQDGLKVYHRTSKVEAPATEGQS